MRTIIYGMMQSLDGYIAGAEGEPELPQPDEALHRYFNDIAKASSAELYGRRMYEVMRYWDGGDKTPGAPQVEIDFARAWQQVPKIVVSTTLREVGPNARLISRDLESAVRALKAEGDGIINVAGATLAASLSALGLIDEYRLYLLPVVLGGGKPFFAAGSNLKLKPLGTATLPQGVVMLRYGRAD
jgi:dihydrofolate reductase